MGDRDSIKGPTVHRYPIDTDYFRWIDRHGDRLSTAEGAVIAIDPKGRAIQIVHVSERAGYSVLQHEGLDVLLVIHGPES